MPNIKALVTVGEPFAAKNSIETELFISHFNIKACLLRFCVYDVSLLFVPRYKSIYPSVPSNLSLHSSVIYLSNTTQFIFLWKKDSFRGVTHEYGLFLRSCRNFCDKISSASDVSSE